MTAPRFGPPDASLAPRYTGPRTFARLPHVAVPEPGVDAAVIGIPFDTATSFRSGARFGPEAVRSASALLRPYHPALDVDVFETLSVVDGGDLQITPGNALRSTEQIDAALRPVIEAGIVPLAIGGDHSIVLGELRAQAAVHGPVGLVLIDAHADTWDQYYGERYFHGTPFRRAVEEGLLEPARSLLAGMRGPLYGAGDVAQPVEMGFEVIDCNELRRLSATPERYRERVLERVGEGPLYMSFDIDALDPAFAPGTGTPEPGGLSTAQAFTLLEELSALPFVGMDCVEVAPVYDHQELTSLAAAQIVWTWLSGRVKAMAP
ncbi:MAG: agmatinase [Solirubrobacteraceae bacterium]